MNRTLVELVRAMLSHKGLSKTFWAQTLATASYIRNRLTSAGLPVDMTPYHLWKGSRPIFSHLRVFGSKGWYAIPKQNLKKLDSRSRHAIFIGYAEQSKAYKVLDVSSNKVIASRDVIFEETGKNDFVPKQGVIEHSIDDSSNEKGMSLDPSLEQKDENSEVLEGPASLQHSDESGSNSSSTSNENIADSEVKPAYTSAAIEHSCRTEADVVVPSDPRRSGKEIRAPGSLWQVLLSMEPDYRPFLTSQVPLTYGKAVSRTDAKFW